MDCLICQEHFTDLLEDAVTASPAAGAHLANCAACATEFAAFRETVGRLRDLPAVPAPAYLPGRIGRALDELTRGPSTAPAPALWQPLTAGLSMAACLLLVLWAVVLNPVNAGWDPTGSQVTYNPPSPPVGMAAPALAPAAPVSPAPPRVSSPRRAAYAPGFVPMRTGARGGGGMQPPDLGSWGEKLAQLPPAGGGATAGGPAIDPATGKPVGTFAAGDPVTPEAPLHRHGGAVQLAFVPPVEKTVGLPVVSELTVVSQAEAMIVLRVQSPPGLRVMRAPQGIVYEGPMRQGETLRVPVRLLARQAGTYRLRVELQSDVPGVAANLEVIIPGFTGEVGKNEPGPVSLRFKATPSLQAIRELAAAAGARVVLHEDVETRLVTLDFSAGVPFAAALRVLCDDCGYRIEERNGVHHVLR